VRVPEQGRSQKRIGVDVAPLAANYRLLCSQVRISGLGLSVNGLSKSPPVCPDTFIRLDKLRIGFLIIANEASECLLLKLVYHGV
jgi:hypothetical protein